MAWSGQFARAIDWRREKARCNCLVNIEKRLTWAGSFLHRCDGRSVNIHLHVRDMARKFES